MTSLQGFYSDQSEPALEQEAVFQQPASGEPVELVEIEGFYIWWRQMTPTKIVI